MSCQILKTIAVGISAILTTFSIYSQCNVQASVCESNSLSQSFNFTNVGSAYAGGSFADAGCSTGAGGNHSYGFITLYITQSGPLNLLVSGNASTGFIDVAIFQVPPGNDPCTAIQSSSNAIGCNFADFSSGCVQFGSEFGCQSIVDAPYVNAGDEILIVVQNYTSGTSTSFNLQLSDNGAQTGQPNASINPNSLGPFCSTDGLMQIEATNMGGIWSGAGMQANGFFNPAVAGVGTHTINYAIGVAPCNSSSSAQITVGSVNISDLNVGVCQGNSSYSVNGTVNIVNPPATGNLIVEDCNGQQVVVQTAPFTVGAYPFNISNLTSTNSNCSLHAYFTNSSCSHILNYTQPVCDDACGIGISSLIPTGCQADNSYTINGVIEFGNEPTTGQLIIQSSTGASQTFNPPFSSPTNFSFANQTANGQTVTITAQFTDEVGCSTQSTYTAPSIPTVDANDNIAICEGNNTTLTVTGTASSYAWSNGYTGTSNLVTPAATTTYTVTGTLNGCSATDQVTVNVNANLVPTITPSTSVCIGTSTTITVSSGASYQWNNGLGNSNTHTVTPAATTTYTVTVTDAAGCSGTASTTVTVNPLPIIIGTGATICADETATIFVEGANTYSWSPALGLNSTTGANVIYTPGQSTNYTVVGTDENGCVNQTTVAVTVYPLPQVEAGASFTGCEGDEFTLIGSGAGSQATYVWNNGVIDGQAFESPVGTTTYIVTGTTMYGCSGTDSTTIYIDETPVVQFLATQDQPCNPVTGTFVNQSTNGDTYVWHFDNGEVVTGEGPITQEFNFAGSFGASLTVTSPYGCVATDYQSGLITVEDKPNASFVPSPAIFSLSTPIVSFNNHSTGAVSYDWNFGIPGANSNAVNPKFTYPNEVENYNVVLFAYSQSGCVDSFEYIVQSEEDLIFYIPNTFTPDGDEFNQSFQPIFTSGFDPYSYTMVIYNRWGEPIFETHDVNIGWKGNYGLGEEICQSGMYTWKIEFRLKYTDERQMHAGHVNLLK